MNSVVRARERQRRGNVDGGGGRLGRNAQLKGGGGLAHAGEGG